MKRNNKGFTLAEMLIVVAIIGVLIAIVTTTISNSLEKAREAVDLANIRSACSEMINMAILDEPGNDKIGKSDNDGGFYRTYVKCKSIKDKWQTSGLTTIEKKDKALICNEYCPSPNEGKPFICISYYPSTDKFSFIRYDISKASNKKYYN